MRQSQLTKRNSAEYTPTLDNPASSKVLIENNSTESEQPSLKRKGSNSLSRQSKSRRDMMRNISKSQLKVFQDVQKIGFPVTTRHSRQQAESDIYSNSGKVSFIN